MATSEDVLAVLRSIDASLKQLVVALVANAPKPVASDRDLDGKYGDPILKFMPRDWTGPSFKDLPFSACPPDLLEMVAETFDYFARTAEEKNETTANGKPTAPYKRLDAARARGWAKRKRGGWESPAAAQSGSGFSQGGDGFDAEPADMTSDDIPF